MFRSKTKVKKSKSKGLLNLSLQDREWLVTSGNDVTVDIEGKNIELSQKDKGTDTYTPSAWELERIQSYNKAMKIIALVEAKYGGRRNLVGVKHIPQDYIDMATKLSVYWYVEKKAFPKYNMKHSLLWYVDEMKDHDARTTGIYSMYVNNQSVRSIAKTIIDDPFLCIRGIRSQIAYAFLGHKNENESPFASADNDELRQRVRSISRIILNAYHMANSVRKDAKAFPNKKIKEIAQYLYDELEEHHLYAPLLSDSFKEMGDIELDLQGMDFDDDINQKVGDAIRHASSKHETDNDIRWAKMRMVYPPLVKSLGSNVLGKSKKNSDIGVNPKNMHRRLTDNKVFQVKSKRKSGTVLVDVSGSMSFTEDDILEIISTLPASTVAIYSGMDYPTDVEPQDAYGELQIVGKDGKYVSEIPKHGYNNLIDGPAIDWLSRQAEPRILVSDLMFTGVNYKNTRAGEVGVDVDLFAKTMQVIASKNILPIPDIDTAKEWVRRFGGRKE